MIDFTVAICTYNGESRLPQVLERLKAQIGTQHLSWEVLVVNNNSTDRTAEVVQAYQLNWLNACSLVYCHEPRQGLAIARQRAILSARGRLVGFLDDDNIPELDWVAQAYEFAQTHPQAGAFGGQVHGDFEVTPPANFKRIASFLAIVERGKRPFIYQPQQRMLPPGAGLVVRREAWLNHVPQNLRLQGRVNKSMLASEDLEVLCHMQNGGWEIWYNPAMQIQHKIPRSRFEHRYLRSLVRGIGLARHHIRMLRIASWQRPFFLFLYMVNDLRRLVSYFIRNNHLIEKNVVTACEWEFLFSSFISPFYLFNRQLMSWMSKLAETFKTEARLSSAD